MFPLMMKIEKSEDTLTILNEYVDLSGDEYDKSKIKEYDSGHLQKCF